MARLPALIDAIAAHDPRGRGTILHTARLVREEGLIASTTRGAGAASMTYKDAATLLMATCGALNPFGAVAAVKQIADLVPAEADQVSMVQRQDLPAHFDWLRERISFGETLERLIAHAPQLTSWERSYVESATSAAALGSAVFSLMRAAERVAGSRTFRPGLARPIRVIFYPPGVAAEVHLGWVWEDLDERDAFHEYFVTPDCASRPPQAVGLADHDILIPVEVGLPTLLSLHEAVHARPRTRGPGKRSHALSSTGIGGAETAL